MEIYPPRLAFQRSTASAPSAMVLIPPTNISSSTKCPNALQYSQLCLQIPERKNPPETLSPVILPQILRRGLLQLLIIAVHYVPQSTLSTFSGRNSLQQTLNISHTILLHD